MTQMERSTVLNLNIDVDPVEYDWSKLPTVTPTDLPSVSWIEILMFLRKPVAASDVTGNGDPMDFLTVREKRKGSNYIGK